MICVDVSLPALSSLPTTMTFLIQQICLEPDIQTRIQVEIDGVVGEGRLPTLDDRVKYDSVPKFKLNEVSDWSILFIRSMPFTEAVLREIMRYETLVPNGLAHKALKDTEFLGYNIPKVSHISLDSHPHPTFCQNPARTCLPSFRIKTLKTNHFFQDTVIVAALSSANHDESVWEEPHKFKPERFLDCDGNLSLKNDVSLPFSAGKRLCAGETFARNMLFLFTTAFFQTFNVNSPPGAPINEFKYNLSGLIRTTPDHWVQYHARWNERRILTMRIFLINMVFGISNQEFEIFSMSLPPSFHRSVIFENGDVKWFNFFITSCWP